MFYPAFYSYFHIKPPAVLYLPASPTDDSVRVLRQLLERLQAEIKFKQTKIEALNFEIAPMSGQV